MANAFVIFGENVINVKNLGWLHRNLRYIHSVRLTPCYCSDCIRGWNTGIVPHDFCLRVSGSMPRGRRGRFKYFEYVTSYASFAVFDAFERKRLEAWAGPVKDEVR